MNRYGRHGARAWLRRHKRRRQQQTSTSLAVVKPFIPLIVFNLTIPAGVERVIIIMVTNHEDFDETDGQENIRRLPPAINQDAQKTERRANMNSQELLDQIKKIYGSSPIYLDEEDIRKYAISCAKELMKSIVLETEIFTTTNDLYEFFVQVFKQGIKKNNEEKAYHCNIQEKKDWQLSEDVKTDKFTQSQLINGTIQPHELGIIYAMDKLNITPREARSNPECLQSILECSTTYVDCYNREEVIRVISLERFL